MFCDVCNKYVQHDCVQQNAKQVKTKKGVRGGRGGFLCFPGCGKGVDANVVVDFVDIVAASGTYKRRPTVQFNLSNGSLSTGDTVQRRITKQRQSNQRSHVEEIMKAFRDRKYGSILPSPYFPQKLLLVFPTEQDQTAGALRKAAEKLSFEVSQVDSSEKALEEFQLVHHDLIIVDSRSSKIDYELLCRSIRNTQKNEQIILLSIVKKSAYERDDSLIQSHLEMGFNRCLVETGNSIVWLNELTQVKRTDYWLISHLATTDVLYTAINGCREPVVVTDDNLNVQYMNDEMEKMTEHLQEELRGKMIHEQLLPDDTQVAHIMSSLARGRLWRGLLTFKRKTLDNTTLRCKAIPAISHGRLPTHYIIIGEMESDGPNMQSRGSINSVRKGSVDIKSEYRRTSLAKLPLEAPITKIHQLIHDSILLAQKKNPQISHNLEKALDMLKITELYSPSVKEEISGGKEEPVASDLLSALFSHTNLPGYNVNSRRSSNDSSIYRMSKGGLRIKNQALNQIDQLLESALQWDFDVFRLEDLSDKRPLLLLGRKLFTHFDIANTLQVDETTIYNWLMKIEINYRASNTYHNSTHAADVMQAVAGFLEQLRPKEIMEEMDEAAALIAAATHDIDHPGKSSAFLANSMSPLAILYNDISILESHHAALTFKITMSDEKCDIFKNLDREGYRLIRYNVIDMILATEMTKHFEHLAKFVNVFCPKDDELVEPEMNQENKSLVKRIMIKCADVSNPTRPLRICVEWSRRIAEEYFQQTDEEKKLELPVVMPMFDRATCSIPKSQIAFIDFILNDMMESWNSFVDMPELVNNMRANYARWKELDEEGIINVEDIMRIQKELVQHKSTNHLEKPIGQKYNIMVGA